MEGADDDTLGVAAQQIIQALSQLPGGALSEGHRGDVCRLDITFGHQPPDALGEGPRLARTGSGDDRYRSADSLHGLQLFGIETTVGARRFGCGFEEAIDTAFCIVFGGHALDDVGSVHVGGNDGVGAQVEQPFLALQLVALVICKHLGHAVLAIVPRGDRHLPGPHAAHAFGNQGLTAGGDPFRCDVAQDVEFGPELLQQVVIDALHSLALGSDADAGADDFIQRDQILEGPRHRGFFVLGAVGKRFDAVQDSHRQLLSTGGTEAVG